MNRNRSFLILCAIPLAATSGCTSDDGDHGQPLVVAVLSIGSLLQPFEPPTAPDKAPDWRLPPLAVLAPSSRYVFEPQQHPSRPRVRQRNLFAVSPAVPQHWKPGRGDVRHSRFMRRAISHHCAVVSGMHRRMQAA